MAYAIRLLEGNYLTGNELWRVIETRLGESRFTVKEAQTTGPNRWARKYKGGYITLHNIRLRESKPYCGNHPGPCLINTPHIRRRYLEGLDWVEFNDLINNALDDLGIVADVASSECVVRKGAKRRVNYRMERLRNLNRWAKVGLTEDYQDWCEKYAPRSKYPLGTPGLIAC